MSLMTKRKKQKKSNLKELKKTIPKKIAGSFSCQNLSALNAFSTPFNDID